MTASLPLLRSLLLDKELWPPGSVRTRRTLEFGAIEALGMKPNTFSNCIRELRLRGDVGFKPITGIGSQWATHLYYQDYADAKQLRDCKSVLVDREQLLRPHLLKAAGEIKTRALFKRAFGSDISQVPQTRRLGYEELDKVERRADLTFIVRCDRKHVPCIVEVKNHREHLHSSKGKYIGKLMRQSIKTGSQPIFMASHISPDLARICCAIGVATHSYGRQFIRSADRAETKRLFPRMWKRQFQFVRLDRVFAVESDIDPRSLEDLRAISDPSWLLEAHRQWLKMRSHWAEISEALLINDRAALRRLIPQ